MRFKNHTAVTSINDRLLVALVNPSNIEKELAYCREIGYSAWMNKHHITKITILNYLNASHHSTLPTITDFSIHQSDYVPNTYDETEATTKRFNQKNSRAAKPVFRQHFRT